MQGVRNVLAHERLFLPTVDTTIDSLRIAHRRIMPYSLTDWLLCRGWFALFSFRLVEAGGTPQRQCLCSRGTGDEAILHLDGYAFTRQYAKQRRFANNLSKKYAV